MTTTPPREYRVDPDDHQHIVMHDGAKTHTGERLWADLWSGRYLGDEDVEGWTRLIPAPSAVHATLGDFGIDDDEWTPRG